MKKLYPFFILAIFALGACTETVEIEKLIFDTVYVDRPGKPIMSFVQTTHVDTVYKELLRVDTVEVTVVVHETDTVFEVRTDSVFIETVVEKIVNHWDTVIVVQIDTVINEVLKTVYVDKIITVHDTITEIEYQQTVIYEANFYLFPGQSAHYIPAPLQTYYDQYRADAAARNIPLLGGELIIQYVKKEDLPGIGWSSNYTEISGFQSVISLDEGLRAEDSKAALYREFSRWQLRKQYVQDINKIMSPYFDNSRTVSKLQIDELFL